MKHSHFFCASLLLMMSAACGTSTRSQVDVASTPSPQVAKADHSSASPGKPAAPVNVEFQPLASASRIGLPMSVKAVVTPTADIDAMEVRFSLSEGLLAVPSLPVLDLGAQKAGVPLEQTLQFSPRAQGQQYLNVFVTIRRGEQRMGKTMSFPIAVGNIASAKTAQVQTGPDGERVISMPATELR